MKPADELQRSASDESKPESLPLRGEPLAYDQGFGGEKNMWIDDSGGYDVKDWMGRGEAAKQGAALGLPFKVEGQLGCGCDAAYLHGMAKIHDDGTVEADYICQYNYHNYIIFQLHQNTDQKNPDNQITLDKFGNATMTKNHAVEELEQF